MSKDEMIKLFDNFEKGIKLYKEGKFSEALSIFLKCVSLNPEDQPSKIYVERCMEYAENPPDKWDGVFTMDHK